MNKTKFAKAQDTLSGVVYGAIAVAVFCGIDYANTLADNDLTAFGAVAYPVMVCGGLLVASVALAVKVYGYRLAKTYR
jgi:hypothetical protein